MTALEDVYTQFEALLDRAAYKNAEAVVTRMLALEPEGELGHVARARLLMAQQRHGDAVQHLLRLQPAKARMPVALACLGEAMLHIGKDPIAEECARKSLEIAPDNPGGMSLMGRILVKLERWQDAAQVLGNLTRTGAASAQDWQGLGMALKKLKRHEASVQAFTHLAQARPQDPKAWMDLVRARLDAADHAGALADITQLLTRHPRDADVLRFAHEVRQMGTTTSQPLAVEISLIRQMMDRGEMQPARDRLAVLQKMHRPTRALKFIAEELAVSEPAARLMDARVRLTELLKQYKEAWEPRALFADVLLRSGSPTDAAAAVAYAEEAWTMSGGHPRAGIVLVRALRSSGKGNFAKALAAQLRVVAPEMADRIDKALA